MFISVGQLERQMGVNKTIGRFFVDRKPPENNSFWKQKLLYISFGNGYLSIPVYYDLLHRIGIPLETLLQESHIIFMEQVMHFAILNEKGEIIKSEEQKCIRNLLKDRIRNKAFYDGLCAYLDQQILMPMNDLGTSHPSLNRADVFLYVLCDLPLNESQLQRAVRYWYALHPCYLILDDIRDYADDKEEGEENIVIGLGDGRNGFEKAFEILKNNSKILSEVNPLLAQLILTYEEDLKIFIPVNM